MTQNPINNSASELTVDNLFLDGNTISSTDTNGNVIIAPDGTGEVSVTAAPIVPSTDRADSLGSATNSWDNVYADGLTFDDGTNVLGNYVDITSWTPALAFGGGTTGIDYDFRTGNYTRIGNVVFFSILIDLKNKGSSTGNATITGFPLTTGSVGEQAIAIGKWNAISFNTGRSFPSARMLSSSSTFDLQQSGNNVTFLNLTNANCTNDTRLFFTGTLMVV